MDNWEEIEVNKDDTQTVSIEDFCNGEVYMEEKDDEKYLGDIVSNDGINIKNIKARVNKGAGIVTRIMTLLEGIPFGKF